MRELSAALVRYDRTASLLDGVTTIDGYDLQIESLPPSTIFAQMAEAPKYDIAEMSLAAFAHLSATERCPLVGIPVFLSRAFRHSMVYVRNDANINRPEELNGRRIAIREWGMTALVWIIGILQDEYQFDLASVQWVVLRKPRAAIKPPPGVQLHYAEEGESISTLLQSGRVDAALFHERLSEFEHDNRTVRRLFEDYATVERDYYLRTRVHPQMHCVVVRKALVQELPELVRELYLAFLEAQEIARNELLKSGTFTVMLPFLQHHVEEAQRQFGHDWWPYGLAANRSALQLFLRYVHEQGLTDSQLEPETLFAAAEVHS